MLNTYFFLKIYHTNCVVECCFLDIKSAITSVGDPGFDVFMSKFKWQLNTTWPAVFPGKPLERSSSSPPGAEEERVERLGVGGHLWRVGWMHRGAGDCTLPLHDDRAHARTFVFNRRAVRTFQFKRPRAGADAIRVLQSPPPETPHRTHPAPSRCRLPVASARCPVLSARLPLSWRTTRGLDSNTPSPTAASG